MFPQLTIGPEVIAALQIALAVLGAYFVAFSLGLVVWTYQDIRGRSRSGPVHFLAALLVLALNLPGLLLYVLLRPPETLSQQYQRALEEEAILQDLEERLACPTCKRGIKEDFLICPYCRTQLKRACPRCGQALHALWKACPYCTVTVVPEPATTPSAIEPAPEMANLAAREALPEQRGTA